jgi:hypothetical protein
MSSTDINQIIYSYLPLEEALNIPDIKIKVYCKYTQLEKSINMNLASRNGHLEVVKYLHSIGKECTTSAMDWASKNGHLEVVKYIHSIGKGCTVLAMDWSSRNGHLDVVEYLHSIKKNVLL